MHNAVAEFSQSIHELRIQLPLDWGARQFFLSKSLNFGVGFLPRRLWIARSRNTLLDAKKEYQQQNNPKENAPAVQAKKPLLP